ncbi:uncharacterized protein LOC124879987 [Girardinichthys multiradiatus]|uniref:uncharacterized protein LOC124879987 n=1 Tax=Girardinichthys multiradiatus TaxID=208333 RepID=UPI001FAD5406|nr:uncharacterized protein LOC124879987 [Girardinichthys multiradiatus]
MVGPRVHVQFSQLNLGGVSLGPPGARGPAGDVLEPAVGFFSPRIPSSVPPLASRPQSSQDDGHLRPYEGSDPGLGDLHLASQGCDCSGGPLGDTGLFYSVYFLLPKKTGGLRPILDLRGLNAFLKVMPFHMLTTREVLQAISPGRLVHVIDLKDAYFHVPFAPDHWRFLRFAFHRRQFQFRVLSFGLSLSPQVFTRCVAVALSLLQARGLRILPYLDDWLICAVTRDQAIQDTWTVQSLSQWRNGSYIMAGIPLGPLRCWREVVHVDASSKGWGATWQDRAAQGVWFPWQSGVHINVLEPMAVFLALRAFLPGLLGRHVLVRSDNTTVVFHINHQGGFRSLRLLSLTRRLLGWAAPRLASLRAVYIPGLQNVSADFLSRQVLLLGEWRLHAEVVDHIWATFCRAEVDLFASRDAVYCPLWFSLMDSASPLGCDALAHEWPRTLLYAIPPDPPDAPEGSPGRARASVGTPVLAGEALISSTVQALLRLADAPPLQERPPIPDGGRILHPDPGRLKLWLWPLQVQAPPSPIMGTGWDRS